MSITNTGAGNSNDESMSFGTQEMDDIVKVTQSHATSTNTMTSYTSLMKEMQRSVDRRIYSNIGESSEGVVPLSKKERNFYVF